MSIGRYSQVLLADPTGRDGIIEPRRSVERRLAKVAHRLLIAYAHHIIAARSHLEASRREHRQVFVAAVAT